MLEWLKGIEELHQIVAYLAAGGLCLCAMVFGSIRERIVAVIVLLDALSTIAFIGYLHGWGMVWAISSKTLVLFVSYAALSWRWPHIWLIAMTSLQFIDLLLVMAVFVDRSILISANGLLRNVVGWLMLLTFAVAIVQTTRARLMKTG
ncbi:hypothetical protein [Brevundimonas variabilis]|uniref:Uncharacterized protein n=1 Tax=Brevundimonas variabilis TaxID=74312 RepID=A0A7W9CIC3_9CAUL|nr:hypothetical protein [Brevundimonas variabilis]MBB5746167.1 hypothetical protein [Brevundimonas variabilis]